MALRRSLPSLLLRRHFSQSTSLPLKPRVRDHSFDAITDLHKKLRLAVSLRSLLLPSASASDALPVSRFISLARRSLSLSPAELSRFLLRHPHVFHVFDHPVQRLLFVRLTPRSLSQFNSETLAVINSLPSTVVRLKKLLLMTTPLLRLRLEHIRLMRYDFGLPDDFEQSVILSNPLIFRLVTKPDSDSTRTKYVELVESGSEFPDLRIPVVEKSREREYRLKGTEAEDCRFAFPIKFPPGFKIGKYFRVSVWKWQRLPYSSPYEDISNHDLRSLEAQKRIEKRAVATIHELLNLTVAKKTTLERIAVFRQAMNLPKKLKEFLLKHQGIFYISTRGNEGKLHTVFLREAYFKGELLEGNEIYYVRKKLEELICLSPQKANVERMFTSLGTRSETGRTGRGSKGLGFKEGERERDGEGSGSGSDSGVEEHYFE
ncbi:hypothetical protein LUZ60_011815 [Juncus effusus]|nr:hypothetical protein LUZ60_011815 [Juncus effusus]